MVQRWGGEERSELLSEEVYLGLLQAGTSEEGDAVVEDGHHAGELLAQVHHDTHHLQAGGQGGVWGFMGVRGKVRGVREVRGVRGLRGDRDQGQAKCPQ